MIVASLSYRTPTLFANTAATRRFLHACTSRPLNDDELAAALAWNTRGRAALVQGDPVRAETPLREAAAILGRLQDTWAIRYTLTHLADAAALRGYPGRAALLYGAADLLIERNVSHFPVLQQLSDRCRAAAREHLGADLFAVTHRRGRALPLDDAVALAAGPG